MENQRLLRRRFSLFAEMKTYLLRTILTMFFAATIVGALALPLSARTPAALTAPDAPKQKPNIVVILADDYGWGSAHCYGAPATLKTPNLDRLAHEGRRFKNAYAPSSVCSPTRATPPWAERAARPRIAVRRET